MNNLNPGWNVGRHDKLDMQLIPLKLLVPHERKEFAVNLLKNINPKDTRDRKQRG
ncbi:hypothetical protein DCAR_0310759 [Daucus carota subsp. sativus]|uniref:Uncharacterized protein n=1 Tax=Daucus carota subsp. sativus TaxID=79200 RepID=A0AAF0WP02_DAUCS|nr:hypothetical protein DCAR_0310759 [Daucus carota subsp. sativus]